MSHVSGKINIDPSHKYQRLILVVTACACISMYVVGLPCILRMILLLGLFWTVYQTIVCPLPHPDLEAIVYQNKQWTLCFTDKHLVYEQLHIGLDTGLFLLLQFDQSKSARKQAIVVFYDQLSQTELRHLNVIHTIAS